MQREIVIAGAGGFGREAAWTLERINAAAAKGGREPAWKLLGFADDAAGSLPPSAAGIPVLGTLQDVLAAHPGADVFLAIGDNGTRRELAGRFAGRRFPALADPSADVAPDAVLGEGAYVGPQTVVSVGAVLGRFAIANARSGIGHDVRIGDFAHICPGATMSGNAVAGEGALVASNASVVPGAKIGDWAKISAGVPVYCDIGPGALLSPFGVFRQTPAPAAGA